jgi:hypothetical protein
MESGFEIKRMKFGFDGTAFTPNLYYYFLWATQNGDLDGNPGGNVSHEQAWVRDYFADTRAFRIGQIRNPAFHEMDTSSSMQLASERSLALNLITGSNEAFTQSFSLIYDSKDSPITAEIGVGDGFVSGNTSYVDKNEGANQNWGVFGRVNFFAMGPHNEYKDFSAINNKSDLLVLGVGGDVTEMGDDVQYLWTVDAQWENTAGLGVYAAAMGNYFDSGALDDQFCNYAFLIQAGYMINPAWEIFARYDYTKIDENLTTGGHDEFCEITLGVNWFVGGGHDAKVTLDLSWLPNGCPSDLSAIDYLATEDDELMIRGTFQLLL